MEFGESMKKVHVRTKSLPDNILYWTRTEQLVLPRRIIYENPKLKSTKKAREYFNENLNN